MTDWGQARILEGKKAVVIGGGGGGIGSGISEAIARAGADLAVVDLHPTRAAQAAEQLGRFGGTAVGIAADILNPADVERLVGDAEAALGGIDILVTVVGGQTAFGLPFVPLHEYTDEQIQRSLGLNIGYVLSAVRLVVPVMLRQGLGGSIVSIGSVSGGPNGAADQATYGAAKAGVSSLSRSIGAEYGYARIRMNVVSPGSIETPATAAARKPGGVDTALERIPLGRRGLPADIANSVVFLASDLSSYVTGQTLTVDGGASACHPLIHRSQRDRRTATST